MLPWLTLHTRKVERVVVRIHDFIRVVVYLIHEVVGYILNDFTVSLFIRPH